MYRPHFIKYSIYELFGLRDSKNVKFLKRSLAWSFSFVCFFTEKRADVCVCVQLRCEFKNCNTRFKSCSWRKLYRSCSMENIVVPQYTISIRNDVRICEAKYFDVIFSSVFHLVYNVHCARAPNHIHFYIKHLLCCWCKLNFEYVAGGVWKSRPTE